MGRGKDKRGEEGKNRREVIRRHFAQWSQLRCLKSGVGIGGCWWGQMVCSEPVLSLPAPRSFLWGQDQAGEALGSEETHR